MLAAAASGHSTVIRVLASFQANITSAILRADGHYWTPLCISVFQGRFESSKTLLLLGAPVTVRDLMHHRFAHSDTRQLRADLRRDALNELARHQAFLIFLSGCSSRGNARTLSMLGGVEGVLEQIAALAGVRLGRELTNTQALGPALDAIDFDVHDEESYLYD